MKRLSLLIVAVFALLSSNAQEEGSYSLYVYDKTNAANIYIPLTTTDGDMYSAMGYTFNGSTDLSGIQVVYGNWEKTYAPAADTWPEVVLGSIIELQEGGTGSGWVYGWTLAETNYVFFQFSTLKLAVSENDVNPITGTTAIKSITSEDSGDAVYFNMQGIQESSPSNGLYIKKQGGKTLKVLVK